MALNDMAFWDTRERSNVKSLKSIEARKDVKDLKNRSFVEEISWMPKFFGIVVAGG